MVIYNMLQKELEISGLDELGINHMLVFSSYKELKTFDFKRFPNFRGSYCSIEIKKTTDGKLALCSYRDQLPANYFNCDGLTRQEIIEKFLDYLESRENQENKRRNKW